MERCAEDGREGLLVAGRVDDDPVLRILLATHDRGRLTEVTSLVNGMRPFTRLRDRVREAVPDLPAETWHVADLPADDVGERTVEPSFPHGPDLSFLSPVPREAASPRPVADLVLRRATSIHGVRRWSDSGPTRGAKRLASFEVDLAGRPLTIANAPTPVLLASAARRWSNGSEHSRAERGRGTGSAEPSGPVVGAVSAEWWWRWPRSGQAWRGGWVEGLILWFDRARNL